MAKDAASLLAQSSCYACFGIGGTLDLLELALVGKWASASQNLIPTNAVYSAGGGFYTFTGAVAGHTYQWVKNANDSSIQDNGNAPLTNTGTFVYDGFTLTLFGTPSAPVTAGLFFVS